MFRLENFIIYCTHYISLSLSYSHDIVVLYCTAAAVVVVVVVAVATFFVVSLGSFLLLLLLLRWRHYCIFCRDRTWTCSSFVFYVTQKNLVPSKSWLNISNVFAPTSNVIISTNIFVIRWLYPTMYSTVIKGRKTINQANKQ